MERIYGANRLYDIKEPAWTYRSDINRFIRSDILWQLLK